LDTDVGGTVVGGTRVGEPDIFPPVGKH